MFAAASRAAARSSAVAQPRVLRLAQPGEHRRQRPVPQLGEERVELLLRRDHRRVVERLEQLRQHRRRR